MEIKYGIKMPISSLPSWERGLKYEEEVTLEEVKESLPSWERGLKYANQDLVFIAIGSLPSWERGLKLSNEKCDTY